MASDVRSRRYGREKADETFTLLSVRWSACSVTASGGGAESCPTVRAASSLLSVSAVKCPDWSGTKCSGRMGF